MVTFQTIRKELNRLRQLLASEKESERTMYRRMVGDLTRRASKKNNRSVRIVFCDPLLHYIIVLEYPIFY